MSVHLSESFMDSAPYICNSTSTMSCISFSANPLSFMHVRSSLTALKGTTTCVPLPLKSMRSTALFAHTSYSACPSGVLSLYRVASVGRAPDPRSFQPATTNTATRARTSSNPQPIHYPVLSCFMVSVAGVGGGVTGGGGAAFIGRPHFGQAGARSDTGPLQSGHVSRAIGSPSRWRDVTTRLHAQRKSPRVCRGLKVRKGLGLVSPKLSRTSTRGRCAGVT